MTTFDIAEQRSEKSEDPLLFMFGFTSGCTVAATGGDGYREFRQMESDAALAGFLEGLASVRARTAKPRDYVRYTAGRAKAVAA
ncbi:hypothetical protein [Streptomyces sp. NPDC059994]|uniref:hypothetical protein n=1 Tax=Streptomyces sp. NPDC059994 TaxID=3347029 RepID=UPI0036A29460